MPFDVNSLLPLYEGDHERVGFVLDDDTIVEVENICSDPQNGFEIRAEDLLLYEDRIKATWHTHPGVNANPSVGDHYAFLNFPDWKHYIIGNNGIVTYEVQNRKVIIAEASIPPRNPEEAS